MSVQEDLRTGDGDGAAPAALDHGSIFFIGTATVLIRYAGFTILTDPSFLHRGARIHLGYGLHATRRTDPAIEIDDLPPLDLVLVSHMHEDHFDRVAAERLDRTAPVVTTHHAAAVLVRKGFQVVRAIRTWESTEIEKGSVRLRVTAMPARHGPPVIHLALPPVVGSLLEFETSPGDVALRLYISGDTLVHSALREIPRRYPGIDIGLLHLGGTRILGVLLSMDGDQGVEALRIVRPHTTLPIHYDDYTVFKSPLDDFKRAVERAGLDERVRYIARGETYTFEVPRDRLERGGAPKAPRPAPPSQAAEIDEAAAATRRPPAGS